MERIEVNNLITRLGQGDEFAMTELYNGISKAVYSFIYTYVKHKETAEDILQDTFIQLIRKPKVFNDSDNGFAYIMTIARNLSLNHIKREKKNQISTMEELDVFSTSTENNSEKSAFLKEFLSTLSEEEKRVLILKESYGFTFQEIAKVMKLSLATVKRRMADVKKSFEKFDTN